MKLLRCAACLLCLAACARPDAAPGGGIFCPPQNVIDGSGNCVAPDVPDPDEG